MLSGKSNIVSFPVTADGLSHTTEATFNTQELIYDAWEKSNRYKCLQTARKALDLWPDCADAYLLLAEESRNPKEVLKLYEQAVAAGERAMGK